MAEYLVGVCTNCSETIYRSLKPLEGPPFTLTPELFAPVKDDYPPPTDGPAMCPICGSNLKWVLESTLQRSAKRGTVDPQPLLVETLWSVEAGEEIRNVSAAPDGSTIILTNRRIVRLRS